MRDFNFSGHKKSSWWMFSSLFRDCKYWKWELRNLERTRRFDGDRNFKKRSAHRCSVWMEWNEWIGYRLTIRYRYPCPWRAWERKWFPFGRLRSHAHAKEIRRWSRLDYFSTHWKRGFRAACCALNISRPSENDQAWRESFELSCCLDFVRQAYTCSACSSRTCGKKKTSVPKSVFVEISRISIVYSFETKLKKRINKIISKLSIGENATSWGGSRFVDSYCTEITDTRGNFVTIFNVFLWPTAVTLAVHKIWAYFANFPWFTISTKSIVSKGASQPNVAVLFLFFVIISSR